MTRSTLTRCLGAALAVAMMSPAFALAADPLAPADRANVPLVQISWGAVLAGAVVALAAHMALSVLGIGIGAAAVDPYDRKNPTKGVPMLLMGWMFVSGLVALFVGGWVSGRLSGTTPFDSSIHGVITWALATIVMFFMLTSSVGFVIGGTFKLLGAGASVAGQAVSAAGQAVGAVGSVAGDLAKEGVQLVKDQVPQLNWDSIKEEAEEMLQGTELEETADNVANKANEVKQDAKKAVKKVQKDPKKAAQEVSNLVQKVYGTIRDGVDSADREKLLNVISEKTGVSKEEATKTIEKWEKTYREAKQKYQAAVAQAEQAAREAADATASTVSRVAIWTFASLAFGMGVAAIGGNLGSIDPKSNPLKVDTTNVSAR